jgi:uncharacterized protein
MRRLAAVVLFASLPALAADYAAEVQAWRKDREAALQADGGWLTVAGLFWLSEGETSFGSGSDNGIVLPSTAPVHAGVFELRHGETRFRLEPGVVAGVGGRILTSGLLRPDTSGEPTVLSLGHLTLHVIERGGRFAIRLKDNDSERRRNFSGLQWYPMSEAYRVVARWTPYAAPARLPVPNILGRVEAMLSPGFATFTLNGQELRLDPVLEEEGATQLFFIFKDETAPRETYGGGRFLYSDLPSNGQLVLDFNKAYSPPCAFTDFATCPLPPKQNRLPVRIEAGERRPENPSAH